ncbi:MAG: hypothetical protein NT116_06075, partial [Candidatus Parcubacteria bacterium]|nr:hypothetical protein [Candidatus Parcubacteria bacterium]
SLPENQVSVAIDPLSEPYNDSNHGGIFNSGDTFADLNTSGGYNKTYYNGTDLNLQSNTLPFYLSPVITSITPDNGPVRTWVTIAGYNFGTVPGKVYFYKGKLAEFPPAPCENYWTNNQIIVVVPEGTETGDVYLVTALGGPTNTGIESNKVRFTVNNNLLGAGLCQITPVKGVANTAVTVKGDRFGEPKDPASLLIFNKNKNATINTWSDKNITAHVPAATITGPVVVTKQFLTGQACVGFHIGSWCPSNKYENSYTVVSSNPVNFEVLTGGGPGIPPCQNDADCKAGGACDSVCVNGFCAPYIKSFSPLSGAVGTWVNLKGCYFCCEPGQVYFWGNRQAGNIYTNNEKVFYQFEGNGDDSAGSVNEQGQNYNLSLHNGAEIKNGVLNLDGNQQWAMTKLTANPENTYGASFASPGNAVSVSAWIKISNYPSLKFCSASAIGGAHSCQQNTDCPTSTSTSSTCKIPWASIVTQGGNNYAPYYSWGMYIDGTGKFFLQFFGVTLASGGTLVNVVPLNKWVNLTGVFWHTTSDSMSHLRGYIDGKEVISSDISGDAINFAYTKRKPLLVGAFAWSYPGPSSGSPDPNLLTSYFMGQINDVRVYNRNLTAKEAQDIYTFSVLQGYNRLGLPMTNPECGSNGWVCSPDSSADEVLVEVPDKSILPNMDCPTGNCPPPGYDINDAIDGPIKLIAANGLSDTTEHMSSDTPPTSPNFDVNNVNGPNICRLIPSTGPAETTVKIIGENFGTAPQTGDQVNFEPTGILADLLEPFFDGNNDFVHQVEEAFVDINNTGLYDTILRSDYIFNISSFINGGDCPSGGWEEKHICFKVPVNIGSGNAGGEGTTLGTATDDVSVTKNAVESAKLNFTVTYNNQCGNGTIDTGEECEGSNIPSGLDCTDFGYPTPTSCTFMCNNQCKILYCDPAGENCSTLDALCGNNNVDIITDSSNNT